MLRGTVDLVYVDPPFATGSDFTATATVAGDQVAVGRAYADAWGGDPGAYLRMLAPRLAAAFGMLSPEGSLYVHCDWRASALVRLVLDEICGRGAFRNEIVWAYRDPSGTVAGRFRRKHDTILLYAKGPTPVFNADEVREPYAPGTLAQAAAGTTSFGRRVRVHPGGKLRGDVWDVPIVNSQAHERLGYPTQKPEALLELIVRASSRPGSIVADLFCGSGTTLAVADRLGRRWVGCDTSSLAIQSTRRRLLAASGPLPEFDVFELGEASSPIPVDLAARVVHSSVGIGVRVDGMTLARDAVPAGLEGAPWAELVDSWAVDWHWDGPPFRTAWASTRTRRRAIARESAPHVCTRPHDRIGVLLDDIFGNRTCHLLSA
jgi:DNA modification methylase